MGCLGKSPHLRSPRRGVLRTDAGDQHDVHVAALTFHDRQILLNRLFNIATTIGEDSKRSRQDKVELGRSFQSVVSSHDWALAESLIPLADTQRLNDALCIALDSIWFLSTQQELAGVTKLIEKLIRSGAHDFTRPALRTSFLASCVSACQSRMMNLADTVTLMAQRYAEV